MKFGLTLIFFTLALSNTARAQTIASNPPPIDSPQAQSSAVQSTKPALRSALLTPPIARPSPSWSSTAKSKPMLLALTLLTASTIADIETTQSCIRAATCREGNPLMGKSRPQAYSVGMSLNALAFCAAAGHKRHTRGIAPLSIFYGVTAMHVALAVHNAELAAK